MASASGFDGDEFSNNLFNDLAPLVALFGESVTTQFLSMSMGWADNFLLAMGPVGIITIVLSAIRIGGCRILKTLIGRARETEAIAELELLSSTSSNVCELWNGQQVTRLIGEPKGALTVLISHEGEIVSLTEAYGKDKGFVSVNNNKKTKMTRPKNNNDDDAATNQSDSAIRSKDDCMIHLLKQFPEKLESDARFTALNLPTNLTLNTRSAPASPVEMWLWAVLGAVLQLGVLVFPGVVTYYLKWQKGDVPVAEYGYPCFAVGTVSITMGIMLCGHIIEGATQETNFVLTDKAKDKGLRFVYLQEAVTIGNEKHPSCTVFLAERDGVLRTSTAGYLKHGHARSRALLATVMTMAGYIVQLVGLRVLHWSAAIFQLAVTLIMVAIRAFARRSLASNPQTSDLSLKGHEMAWLTLLLRFKAEEPPIEGKCLLKSKSKVGHDEKLNFNNNQFLWELILDHSEESGVVIDWLEAPKFTQGSTPRMRDRTGYVCSQLLHRVKGPLRVSLELRTGPAVDRAEAEDDGAATSPRAYAKIVSLMDKTNATDKDHDSKGPSKLLYRTINEVLQLVSTGDDFVWKGYAKTLFKEEQGEPLRLYWGFDIRDGRVSEYDHPENTQKHFQVFHQKDPGKKWGMGPSNVTLAQLSAAISLSLYTNATRLMHATSQDRAATPTTAHAYRRIIGHAREKTARHEDEDQIQQWLKLRVTRSKLSALREEAKKSERKEILNAISKLAQTSGWRHWLSQLFQKPQTDPVGELSKDTERLTRMFRTGVSASYFGMFLSSSAREQIDESSVSSHQFEELLIDYKCPPKHTQALQYAQELFSLFILALASKVERVNGETKVKDRNDMYEERLLENSAFKSIADVVVRRKLAKNEDEAYTLIIPAFAKYNLLPAFPTHKDVEVQAEPRIDESDT